MEKPEKIKKPSKKMSPEVSQIVQELLRDIETRRQMLNRKIPLSQLEIPTKILIK